MTKIDFSSPLSSPQPSPLSTRQTVDGFNSGEENFGNPGIVLIKNICKIWGAIFIHSLGNVIFMRLRLDVFVFFLRDLSKETWVPLLFICFSHTEKREKIELIKQQNLLHRLNRKEKNTVSINDSLDWLFMLTVLVVVVSTIATETNTINFFSSSPFAAFFSRSYWIAKRLFFLFMFRNFSFSSFDNGKQTENAEVLLRYELVRYSM